MRVEILKWINPNTVEFKSEFGNGIATFSDSSLKMGFYDVEFNVKDEIRFGDNATKLGESDSSIKHDRDKNYITGFVENIDVDGEVCFRMSSSSILLFYGTESDFIIGDYLTITIGCSSFEMFIVGVSKE